MAGALVGELIDTAIEREAAWVLVPSHAKPLARIGGREEKLSDKEMTARQLDAEITAIAPRGVRQRYDQEGSADWVFSRGGGRVRAFARKSAGGPSLTFEPMPISPPSLDEIGAPIASLAVVTRRAGIAILGGALRHELSGAMAAHAEDEQRFVVSVGREVPLLRGVDLGRTGHDLRKLGADVLVVADPEGHEQAAACLEAAEGALVLVAVPSRCAVGALQRFLREVREDDLEAARAQLGQRFLGALARRAVRRVDGGTSLVHDVLPPSALASGLLREGRFDELYGLVAGGSAGAESMDGTLRALVRSGEVSEEVALAAAVDKEIVVA